MDAISMLKGDHKTVEGLFRRFEKAGDEAFVEKREIVDRIVEELSVHAAIEEQLFYPVVRATVPGTEDIALESLEEHYIVKWVLSELESMAPQSERFDAKVTVLIENVRHHVKEEEGEFFPMVRDELGRTALNDLGEAMAQARKIAPTHPHPRAPDSPPGNLAAGTASGVVDRIGDTVSGLAQGGVTAAGDLIATVLGRKKPRVSPTGSRAARGAAAQVRSSAADVTASAIATTRKAKAVGERAVRGSGTSVSTRARRTATTAGTGGARTARSARAAVKGAGTSARTSTNRVMTTAKRGATTTGRTARSAANDSAAAAAGSRRTTKARVKRPSTVAAVSARTTNATAKRSPSSAGRSTRTTKAPATRSGR